MDTCSRHPLQLTNHTYAIQSTAAHRVTASKSWHIDWQQRITSRGQAMTPTTPFTIPWPRPHPSLYHDPDHTHHCHDPDHTIHYTMTPTTPITPITLPWPRPHITLPWPWPHCSLYHDPDHTNHSTMTLTHTVHCTMTPTTPITLPWSWPHPSLYHDPDHTVHYTHQI